MSKHIHRRHAEEISCALQSRRTQEAKVSALLEGLEFFLLLFLFSWFSLNKYKEANGPTTLGKCTLDQALNL